MREVCITAKVRLYPCNAQELGLLQELEDACAASCNFLVEQIFQDPNPQIDYYWLNDKCYRTLRSQFGLKAQLAQSMEKRVISALKSINTTQGKLIKPDFKKSQIEFVWNRDFSIPATKQQNLASEIPFGNPKDWRKFSINTLQGRLLFLGYLSYFSKFFDGSWKLGTAKLVRQIKYVRGKKQVLWFLHIPLTKEFPDFDFKKVKNVVGCDRGINFVMVTYDSNRQCVFYSGKEIKAKRGKFKNTRKKLQKKGTSSSRKRIRQIGSRESRYISDVNHQMSKALVDNLEPGTVIVLENLSDIRKATERVRVKNRYVFVSWSFDDLRQKIEYKAALKGCIVIFVDPRYYVEFYIIGTQVKLVLIVDMLKRKTGTESIIPLRVKSAITMPLTMIW